MISQNLGRSLRTIWPAILLLLIGIGIALRVERMTKEFETDRISRTKDAVESLEANQDTMKTDLDSLKTAVKRVETEQQRSPIIVVR